ncbi:acetamidase/formamidase family protein [Undibacterium seohonense]|uniref:Acetamidase/formamidase family protein n=1 Tax=Undibacterium seohonense TaxID=1344950 RepID=A0ABR6X263_9BURK|nr:acetamidase/formamidase family protein [Undibacterium seohonense]MBC3806946.1 acetamidase/formamidase family protein [Undibacterium seohonense]
MRLRTFISTLLIASILTIFTLQTHAQTTVPAHHSYVMKLDRWGNTTYQSLELDEQDGKISGHIDRDPFVGVRKDDTYLFTATAADKTIYNYHAKITSDGLRGTADFPDSNHPQVRVQHTFSANRIPDRISKVPHTHRYVPTSYSNTFSPDRQPVLTIWSGDTVQTKTVDSGGVDEHGATVALYGNPQTGPFYVADADVGDVLAIHIKSLRLNRDYADSLDMIVHKAQTTRLASRSTELGQAVRWKLDLKNGLASPDKAGEKLKNFNVPVKPMLGGLAVAPGNGMPAISTGDAGNFGGNMDFNEVVEGNTIYLAVNQPGALLYLGDAHALQGDGETSQYALETSMAVEFSVEVIKHKQIAMPRVVSPTHIMTLGQAGSLDEALKLATSGMTQWLAEDYGLNLSESAQILGSSMEYRVVNLAGRSVGLAAKLNKSLLKNIPMKVK